MAIYKKYQNTNRMSRAYGKWYMKALVTQTADTNEVAERIQKNASVKISDVKAVLHELKDVLQDLLKEGYRVTLEGIGAFKPSLTSAGALTPEECTPTKCLKKTKVIFQAESYKDATNHIVRPLVSKVKWQEASDYDRPETPEEEPEP